MPVRRRRWLALSVAALPIRTRTGRAAAQEGPTGIGTATMLADGTIVLQLRATGPGVIGDGQVSYRPGDPHYAAVRDHLPPLRPGETVVVSPFD